MKREDIIELARILGLHHGSTRGANILVQCPLAGKVPEHAHSEDRAPSWSIKVDDSGPSLCVCFGCGKRGSVVGFLSRAKRDYGGFAEALVFAKQAEKNFDLSKGLDRALRARRSSDSAPKREGSLKRFIWACAAVFPNYALQRGLTRDEITRWRVGFDPMRDRVTFPVWNENGAPVGIVGRTVLDNVEPKYLDYPGFVVSDYFHGMHDYDATVDEAVIVEGPFDDIMGRRHHPNVFANIGLKTVFGAKKREWLKSHFRSIIFLLDSDPAGYGAVHNIGNDLSRISNVYVALLPEGTDPADKGADVGKALREKVSWHSFGLTIG